MGGVVGGVVIIGLALAALLWYRRRSRSQPTSRFDERVAADGLSQAFYNSPSSELPISIVPLHADEISSSPPETTPQPFSATPATKEAGSAISLVSGGLPTSKHIYTETVLTPDGLLIMSPGTVRSDAGSGSAPSASAVGLTDEQADFVNSLHVNNVPPAAIARVMNRMLAGAAPSSMRGQDWMVDSGVERLAPPSYDQYSR